MEGKEAIVGKILSDAQQKADAIVAEAERAANESLAEWRRALERESTEVVARRETVASLDNRKAMLAAKRAVIDEVLARALASACALPKERYCSLVERLLEEYAQEGDAVTLSASAPLGEKELAACKAFPLEFSFPGHCMSSSILQPLPIAFNYPFSPLSLL